MAPVRGSGDGKIDLGEWKRALTTIQKGKSFAPRPERAQQGDASPGAVGCTEDEPAATGTVHGAPAADGGGGMAAAASPAGAPAPAPVDEVILLERQLAEARARSKQSARDCQTVLAEQRRIRERLEAQQAAAKEAEIVAEVVSARLQVQLAKATALLERQEEREASAL